MGELSSVAIVGGSLAGIRAAGALRRGGFSGRLTFVGAEPHLPYDRPPLSKQILIGSWAPDRALLMPPEEVEKLDLVSGVGIDAVTPPTKTVDGAHNRD